MESNLNKRTTTIEANSLLAHEIVLKWKRYRDAIFRLYEVTNDVAGYEKSTASYQQVIKGWMKKHDQSLIEAVTDICHQEEDARVKIKFISAGYDLASGVEYPCYK